ncbi:MAG: PKD domain-containing protein [Flavobacteriales bacterium]|nr:MAG: PKD domain-containing protein [Flavobacteriales bacterium]
MKQLLQSLLVATLLINSLNAMAQNSSVFNQKSLTIGEVNKNKDHVIELKETFFQFCFNNILIDENQKNNFRDFYHNNGKKYSESLIKYFTEKKTFSGLEINDKLKEVSTQLVSEFLKSELNKPFDPNGFVFHNSNHYKLGSNNPHEHDELFGLNQPCNNPDMETCDFTNWDLTQGSVDANPYGYVGVTAVSAPGSTLPTSASDQHFIVTGGNDPVVPIIPRVNPNGGGCTAQLGDGTVTGAKAASMSQTFLVDINSANFTYSYAAIMEDPSGHTLGEKPYFKARVYDENGNEIVCGRYNTVAGDGSVGWVNNGTVQYKDWTTVFVPLQTYIGTNVKVEFTVGDCSQSGHYGYAYVEASCSLGEILGPDTISCSGYPTMTAPPGAASYLWNTGATTQSIVATAPGQYSVQVIPVTGAACAITLTKDIYEFVDTVTAVFNANPTTICVGQSVSFSESSFVTGLSNITSWNWDFDGNGTIDNTSQNPPPQVYNTPGTYNVTLSTSITGCTDDTTIQIIVEPTATVNFTAPTVCAGLATDFTDASGATVDAWNWDFNNDGFVDNTTQNPSHTFPSAGTYPVNLEVSIGGSCGHDTTINVIVHPNPVANFTATDECLTTATTFTDASNVSTGSITGWAWDFDNNTTTDNTSQNPTYTYGTAGTQTINLTVTTDNNCTNSYSTTVEVFANPIANFSTDAPCEGNATTFTDLSSDGSVAISIWNWDFDNNTTTDNTTQNPTFNLGTANTYPVTLYVEDANGCNHSVTQNVIVNPNPTAGFTFTNVCFGTTTGFTNQSNGNGGTINQFAWDFTNNGTVDNTNQNPTNGYPSAGTYTVELHVTTADGCVDSITRVVTVNPIPVADFSSTTECLGNLTTFTDESTVSTGGVTNWSWDFNDGSPADNNQSPTHVYASAGIYNVTLTVTSDSGCINNYSANVEVYTNPVATFSTDVACLTYATTFTDSSTPGDNPITIWNWDFDNNTTVDNTEQNPTFILPTAGTHNVNLYVEDSHGCNHDTTITVTVSENPIADFDHTIECFGTSTTFTDASNNNGGTTNIDTWEWDFDGNGTIDNTTQSPTFNFPSAGNYPTELVVTSALGCKDSITINVVVDPIPVANFTATTACLEYTTTFTNNSTVATGSITQNDWDFADGTGTSALLNPTYTYTTAGTFNVELTVTSDSGCVHSVIVPVTVHPKPTADFNVTDVCLNVAAPITDASVGNGGTVNQWQWDFTNNGTTDNTTQNPSNLYATDGTFDIKLVVSTTNSCKDTIIKPVTIHPMPTADFTFVNACYGAGIDFTDTSNVTSGTITNWDWSFGNGQTSTLENPTENYAAEGIYNVQLIVTTNNNCKDTVSKNNIEVWPLPVVDFIPTTVCLNNITQFEDQSTVSNTYTTNTITAWSWNFGDGSPLDNNQDPTHTYLTEGVHQATLVVTTSNNCIDSITKDVTVNPLPVVNFVADNFEDCAPVEVTFTDNTAISSGTISKWFWDFNSDGYTDNYGPNPQWSFPNPSHSSVRNYNVTLITESDKGCRDTLTIPNYIHSYPNPLASFMYWPNDQATIVDKELTFTDQSIIGSVWHWDMGDGFTSSVQHPVHEFPDTGFYLVTLAIENVYGCVDTTQKYVQIKPMYAIWIPNAFTPDGDFTNDYFYVDGYGIKELQIQIFDRWGLKIYDEIGIDQSWDGTYKGNLVPTDVYVYKVRAKDIFDEWHDYIGKVTVIK